MTKISIKVTKWGAREVIVDDDNLTNEQKLKLKYETYKTINESYQKLMKNLPKES